MSDEDAHKVQVPRHEMLMERKIKATGERVGGEDWVRATRSTLAHAQASFFPIQPPILTDMLVLLRPAH